MRRLRARACGQATVELVALAPIVILACLIGLQALVAGANFVVAGHVAHAGALAGQLGRSPAQAARSAAPEWSSTRLSVAVRARTVRVRLAPRAILPGLQGLLTTTATARYTSE